MRKGSEPGAAPGIKPEGRRERNRAEIRERLFRAALRLFAEKGFVETTCEDITNAADVGKGTFFNYFPSKDHILMAFGEMQLDKLRRFVEGARRLSRPTPELFRELSTRMTEEPGRNPKIVRILLLANLSEEPVRTAVCAHHKEIHALHTELIEIGQRRGEVRKDRPAAEIASAFRQLIFGTLMLWSLDMEVSLKARIDNAFDLFWNGIAAPRGTRGPSAKK